MNKLTQKIKAKGYTLPEFCKEVGISLRSYRRYEHEDNDNHEMLIDIINRLERKR